MPEFAFMIILSAKNLTKAYGTDVILNGLSFNINKGDRVGIIGANGAGKTTLLNILTGETTFDEGDFFVAQGANQGYLRQSGAFDPERTVHEEMLYIFKELIHMENEMETLSHEIAERSEKLESTDKLLASYDELSEKYRSSNGFGFRSEITGILKCMAFGEADLLKKTRVLSGGEKTRLSLAALLLQKPDLLLLDEPTNHLDIGTLMWLEQYLKSYNGTIVLISHDRYFLDQTVNRIFELENHKLSVFEGNYTTYVEKKSAKISAETELYEKQMEEIKRQEEMIRRFKQHGTEKLAKRAKSREKRLEHFDRPERPEQSFSSIKLRFDQRFKSGNDVLLGEELSKAFGSGDQRHELFRNAHIDIKSGEHICMVGANGIGKTTLLKIFKGDLLPDSGYIRLGHNVLIGYYDQEQELLNYDNNILEEMSDGFRNYSDTQMRSMLGAFLFSGDTVFQKIGTLSGGEKARLSLLKLMLSGANLLLLDEPTNHLDIISKEVFEKALVSFPGAALIISHDRYLLRRIPSRIMELTSDGLLNYLGDYDYYLEKREGMGSGKKYLNDLIRSSVLTDRSENGGEPGDEQGDQLTAAEARLLNKAAQTESRRREKELLMLEDRIRELEDEINEIQEKMCEKEVFSDHILLGEYDERLNALKPELEFTYEKWMMKQSE
ncbi:ABC transporter ATP-binding protein [Clostridia bacterium]|nr:ABC transporter ATP-binding protein [Clostridia bacterium]